MSADNIIDINHLLNNSKKDDLKGKEVSISNKEVKMSDIPTDLLIFDLQGRMRGKSFYKKGKLEGDYMLYNKEGTLIEKRIYKSGNLIKVKPNTL